MLNTDHLDRADRIDSLINHYSHCLAIRIRIEERYTEMDPRADFEHCGHVAEYWFQKYNAAALQAYDSKCALSNFAAR
jgi:hypothetical protein